MRMRDGQGAVIASSLLLSSHVRVGEDEAWARHHHHCVWREGVAGMQTHAAGTGMSVGQQDHTCTCVIPVM